MKAKRTDERIEVLLTALRGGNTRRAAAAYAQISHETFYRWLRDDVTLRDAVEKAEADAEARAVAIVVRAAQGGTWQAAAWWLERRKPDDYGRQLRVDRRAELESEVRKVAAQAGLDEAAVWDELRTILPGVE